MNPNSPNSLGVSDLVCAELGRIAAECDELDRIREANTPKVRSIAARIRAHASNIYREVKEADQGAQGVQGVQGASL